MKRSIFAALAVVSFAIPASAADCAKDYKAFFDQFNNGPAKELTGPQLAIVNRQALRAFDGCNAGDEATTKAIFQRLNEVAPAKDQAFWTALEQNAPAKR